MTTTMSPPLQAARAELPAAQATLECPAARAAQQALLKAAVRRWAVLAGTPERLQSAAAE